MSVSFLTVKVTCFSLSYSPECFNRILSLSLPRNAKLHVQTQTCTHTHKHTHCTPAYPCSGAHVCFLNAALQTVTVSMLSPDSKALGSETNSSFGNGLLQLACPCLVQKFQTGLTNVHLHVLVMCQLKLCDMESKFIKKLYHIRVCLNHFTQGHIVLCSYVSMYVCASEIDGATCNAASEEVAARHFL